MPLKDQVANLELSQQLKDLGFPQESLFYWHYSYNPTAKKVNEPYVLFNPYEKGDEINISAPTVAELGMALAKEKHGIMPSYNSNSEGGWYFSLFFGEDIYADTEADCRAKLLIHLLKNNLIEL